VDDLIKWLLTTYYLLLTTYYLLLTTYKVDDLMKWRWALRGNFWFDAIRATERHCAVEDELLRRSAHAAHMCATYHLLLTTYHLPLATYC
jgi:hypothetical protein